MISRHLKVGTTGENIAASFLKSRGHIILDRNYSRKWGELDIVSRENGIIHFVEVKTISRENNHDVSRATYRPEENMHRGKLKRLHRIVETYIEDKQVSEDWQLDLLAVELFIKDKKATCRLIENVL
jgi:putative endonuclease